MQRSLQRTLAALAGLLLVALLPSAAAGQASDDQALFSTVVPPNVLLLVDNSGSMNNVVWHPEFDPTASPACSFWSDNTQYFVRSGGGDDPSHSGDTDFSAGTYNRCGNTREIFVDPEVEADGRDTRWSGRYLNWYFSDAADPYAEAVAAQNGQGLQARTSCLSGASSPFSSSFSSSIQTYRRARVTAAKDILLEVICEVNASGDVRFGLAQFRRPNSPSNGFDPNGGYVRVPVEDLKNDDGSPNSYSLNGNTRNHGDHLAEAIDDLTGESQTPLAESLFQTYTYFMSRNQTDRPSGANSGVFPEYDYRPDPSVDYGGPESSSGVPGSPVQNACQRHFVIVITDGEPTYDDFDVSVPGSTADGFSSFGSLIGDYHADGETEYYGSDESTRLLDDIAKFMQERDFRPDVSAHDGKEQVIDTYTVGFTTSPAANSILSNTAQVGNGKFFHSNEPDKLATDIVSAVTEIVQKSQSFTAATVPAARTQLDEHLFRSLFVPNNESGFWKGHIQNWRINQAGEIRDKNDDCAVDDPTPGECLSGSFLPVCSQTGSATNCAEPFWDAGYELKHANSPSGRTLTTSRLTAGGDPVEVPFDTANIGASDLDVSGSDISSYDYGGNPTPADADELADALVQNVRGCELGTGVNGVSCVEREWLLGDVFHSTSLVIGDPPGFVNEPSFATFSENQSNRDRVLVAGANDGFLHIFHAGDLDSTQNPPRYGPGTGAEIAGFMPYPARKNAKELPIDADGRSFYYVDGPPAAADVWLYDSPTQQGGKTASQWRTVLVGGLRQGGETVYALDLTDSGGSTTGPERPSCTPIPGTSTPSPGDQYPCYLWEFPRENALQAVKDYMGQTWSVPVLTRVRVSVDGDDCGGEGCERYVAIFGGGYHPESDPNAHGDYDVQSSKGRSIVMLDLKTGEVLGVKRFDPSATTASTNPASVPWDPANPEQSMHFAFPAQPAVYDPNEDGFADVIYIPDLGGNLWKWVVSDVGVDPVNGSGSVDQPDWEFGKIFEAPVYDDGSNRYWKSFYAAVSASERHGTLWIALGSGEQNKLTFEGIPATPAENNRFYALKDPSPTTVSTNASALTTEGDLIDLSGRSDAGCASVSSYDGFFVRAEDGEKFVTESDITGSFAVLGSYLPDSSATPCEAAGTGRLYGIKLFCGEGLFEKQDNSGDRTLFVDLGPGLPTDPSITMSSGSPDGSRIIVNMQGGGFRNEPCDACTDGGGLGQVYWRQLTD